MKRLDNVIKAGAYVGYSRADLLQKEKDTLKPVDSIVDEESLKKARCGVINLDKSFIQAEAKKCKKTDKPLFDRLLRYGQSLYEDFKKENIFAKNLIGNKTRIDRLKSWLQIADKMKDKILLAFFPEISPKISSDFYTWQISRLWFTWIIDWTYKRDCSGQSFENRDIYNDLYDIEYVAYLSRADGLLTRDDRLVKPLAKAAFPEKDVFSSLDEVPEDYVGHWTQ